MHRRWQDWTNLALGAWLFASPWILGYKNGLAGNAWAFGLFVVVVSAWALLEPDSRTPETANAAFGAWVFLVPWLLGFGGATSLPTWNAWIIGGAVAGLAVWSLELISVATPHHA